MSFGLPVFTNKVFFYSILYIRLMEEILHQEMVSFPYQLVLPAGFLPSKKQRFLALKITTWRSFQRSQLKYIIFRSLDSMDF